MQIFIPAKKRAKLLIALCLHVVLIALLINTLLLTPSMTNLAYHGLFNYLISGTGLFYAIYMFTEIFLFGGKEWFDKAYMEISDDAIINNLNYYSSGVISFDNIAGTELRSGKKGEYLIVKITNPHQFIVRKSFLAKILLRKLMKKFGSPIIIQRDSIRYNLEELKVIIEKRMFEKLHTM